MPPIMDCIHSSFLYLLCVFLSVRRGYLQAFAVNASSVDQSTEPAIFSSDGHARGMGISGDNCTTDLDCQLFYVCKYAPGRYLKTCQKKTSGDSCITDFECELFYVCKHDTGRYIKTCQSGRKGTSGDSCTTNYDCDEFYVCDYDPFMKDHSSILEIPKKTCQIGVTSRTHTVDITVTLVVLSVIFGAIIIGLAAYVIVKSGICTARDASPSRSHLFPPARTSWISRSPESSQTPSTLPDDTAVTDNIDVPPSYVDATSVQQPEVIRGSKPPKEEGPPTYSAVQRQDTSIVHIFDH